MSRPDEGMIHAWLDGELDAAEAARVEALARNDAEWAAAAAEARGFLAASARIVGALDHVPANVIPKTAAILSVTAPGTAVRAAATTTRRGAPWWAMRAAALLVVAAGVTVVARRNPESVPQPVVDEPAKVKAVDVPANKPVKQVTSAPAPTTERAGSAGPARKENAVAAAAPRDRLDERRAAVGDSAAAVGKVQAEQKLADLKKDAAPALRANALALSSVVTTGVAEPQKSARAEVCYLEPAGPGTASLMHRVNRIDDSTAIAVPPVGLQLEASADRTRQVASGTAAAAPSPTFVSPRMKVRGDTLFMGSAPPARRIALKTSCPAP